MKNERDILSRDNDTGLPCAPLFTPKILDTMHGNLVATRFWRVDG